MIRKATVNDVSIIYNLSKENLETSFKEKTLKKYVLNDDIYSIYVLEIEEVIGFIILWESDEFGEIVDLVVSEEQRRKGYGKSLVEYSVILFKEKGLKSLTLLVSENNDKAIKLYESLGFNKRFKVEKYYKNSDALIYVRSLTK